MDNQYQHFYANAVSLATNIYDVTFVLKSQSPQIDQNGDIQVIDGEPVIIVNEELTVRMSPQHAKAFAVLLVNNLIDYEKKFKVELPLPPELQKLWEKIINK